MKMIITCRRNPDLARAQFFEHLRHVHWPLVQRHPAVLEAVGGYVQNHALGAATPARAQAPCRIAIERDSVIELAFDGAEGLARLIAVPEYLAEVRPDEARFNDLDHNIMVKARPEPLFAAPSVGRCKRFDFLKRNPALSAEDFARDLAASNRRLALDPLYTAMIDRHVDNWPLAEGVAAGFGHGAFDCVRELWAQNFDLLFAAAAQDDGPAIDPDASFSIFATEFVLKAAPLALEQA